MPHRTVRIKYSYGWRPLHAEALEFRRLFFDVNLYRKEIVADVALDTSVGIDLGIQPSASSSHRRGAEVKQHHLAGRLGLLQALIGIAQPLNFRHLVDLP